MTETLIETAPSQAIPLVRLTAADLSARLEDEPERTRTWVAARGFRGKAGSHCVVPSESGEIEKVFAGLDAATELWEGSRLGSSLPAGTYAVEGECPDPQLFALGWRLASYSFDRYRAAEKQPAPVLVAPEGCDAALARLEAEAIGLTRDLITTPAADMGPDALAVAATKLAEEFGAAIEVTVGDDLLRDNYPVIHAVGRAAEVAPRLIDLRWGPESAPKITLVGKGVCFDSGGLDLKPAGGMLLMKKDMGGAANVLGLARMIMASELKLRLRVLIPAVENSVAGNAMRPLDVLTSRSGRTIEVGNTDAEGRLVLQDALTEAASEEPEAILDFATLTGAARVALGTDLPALFCNDEEMAAGILLHGGQVEDPLWRMPLFHPYRRQLDSSVADLNNVSRERTGGAITAALFLEEFVDPVTPWAHIDLMAYNSGSRPGRPEGGEALGIRAVHAWLSAKYR